MIEELGSGHQSYHGKEHGNLMRIKNIYISITNDPTLGKDAKKYKSELKEQG
jgi:hypothetical protein